MKTTVLHEVGEPPRHFRYLSEALKVASQAKTTGYIVTPNDEVINIRKGKRKGVDGKSWVKCDVGY